MSSDKKPTDEEIIKALNGRKLSMDDLAEATDCLTEPVANDHIKVSVWRLAAAGILEFDTKWNVGIRKTRN